MSLLTKKQAADYIGVCESTIDNMESAGLLVGRRVHVGRKKPIVRYHRSDLDALFLKRQRRRSRLGSATLQGADTKRYSRFRKITRSQTSDMEIRPGLFPESSYELVNYKRSL